MGRWPRWPRRLSWRRRPRAARPPSLAMRAALVLVLLALVDSAHAERALTLAEALRLARARNQDLKAAQARVTQAEAGVLQAAAPLLPTVAASGKYTHNFKEVTLNLAAQNVALLGLGAIIKMGNPQLTDAVDSFTHMLISSQPSTIVIQKAEQLDAQ